MHKEVEKYLRLKRKLIVLEYAHVFGSNLEAYKAFGIPKSTFYDWKRAFEEEGEEGLFGEWILPFQCCILTDHSGWRSQLCEVFMECLKLIEYELDEHYL